MRCQDLSGSTSSRERLVPSLSTNLHSEQRADQANDVAVGSVGVGAGNQERAARNLSLQHVV